MKVVKRIIFTIDQSEYDRLQTLSLSAGYSIAELIRASLKLAAEQLGKIVQTPSLMYTRRHMSG